jgi:hypothetical protein
MMLHKSYYKEGKCFCSFDIFFQSYFYFDKDLERGFTDLRDQPVHLLKLKYSGRTSVKTLNAFVLSSSLQRS